MPRQKRERQPRGALEPAGADRLQPTRVDVICGHLETIQKRATKQLAALGFPGGLPTAVRRHRVVLVRHRRRWEAANERTRKEASALDIFTANLAVAVRELRNADFLDGAESAACDHAVRAVDRLARLIPTNLTAVVALALAGEASRRASRKPRRQD